MIIYDAEIEAGLTDTLSAQSSIVYASLAEKCGEENLSTNKHIKENKALAGIDDSDLYYTQSILVTTSWNKNDDIFDSKEVWLAKNTPEDKPTNLEHDENSIVGHITSNWPIDDSGNLLNEDLDVSEIPAKYHILTGSVIYKGYTDPNLRSRADTLIEEIENGNKYVSMECFFKGFDYGLMDKATGTYHVLPRNAETAFLTKHLRAYGGQGEHQNYKIGRVLRQITFSGKGFVNKPANPESIIFTKENLNFNKELANIKNYIEKNDDSLIEGVFSNQANLKETNMNVDPEVPQSEEVVAPTADVVETPVVETPVDASMVEHEEAAKKMKEEEEKNEVEDKKESEKEEDKEEETEAAKKTKQEMAKKDEEMQKMKAALEAAQSELNTANEALAGYKAKEAEMLKKEKKAKRMASLIQSGLDNETAEATVDKLDSLDDETFASVTALVAAKKNAKVEEETKEKDETSKEELEEQLNKKKASVEADASVLETAEVDESVNLSIASDDESQVQNTRAALVDFVCNRLGKKLINKGE
jgi:hypothetical protein